MIQSTPVAIAPPRGFRFRPGRAFVGLVQDYRRWRKARRTRKIVSELTNEQLADAGIDVNSVDGPISILVVERGYHANAAGWR